MCALIPCQSIHCELAVSQIQAPRVRPIEAELVGVVAGRDVPVPASHDVGIHAHRRRARAARGARPRAASSSSSASDSTLKRRMPASSASRISSRDLPTPEKTMLVYGHARALQAVQLAAGDDVEAAAEAGQQSQDREIGVGLDRVADRVRQASQRPIQTAITRP